MKRLCFFLLIATFGIQLDAQVYEQYKTMSLGDRNALTMTIPQNKDKFVSDMWSDYMKEFYNAKSKFNKKTDEWFTDNADIPAIGLGNTIDVYATVEQINDDVRIAVWFDLGGAFLSLREHYDRYPEAEKLMMRFALEVAKKSTEVQLDAEEKKLKDLENDLKKLQNGVERYQKDIERAREAIRKAEEGIAKSEKDQAETLDKIEQQKKAIDAVRRKLNDL